MRNDVIEDLIGTVLNSLNLPGTMTFAWVNMNHSGDIPRVEPKVIYNSFRTTDLKGVHTIRECTLLLTFVNIVERGNTLSNQVGSIIAAGFPVGLRISSAPIQEGEIVITHPLEIKDGFREGKDWRVPMQLNFNAFT